jgi:Transmembrane domain of unknown function (DUF3566)
VSTQPGKNAGRSSDTPASGKAKKVVQAAAKPGREETIVEISPLVSDETMPDLGKVTEDDPSDPEPPQPVVSKAEVDKPVAPVRDTSSDQGWATPSDPSDSEPAAQPFSRPTPPAPAAAPPPPPPAPPSAGPSSSRSPRSGYAGTVLKDRPSAKPAPAPAKASSAKPANAKSARKAQLQLARLEPWSVMKFSFVMSLVCFVVLLVAVIVLYMILSGLGVFDAITDTVNDLTRHKGETDGGVDAGAWFSFARVFGYTVLVGALNVLLITALSTVGSVIYNLAADLVGGVEVTLKEAE